MKSSEQTMPRARKEGLLVQELADELLVYDRIRHKAHCLNETAALIWNNCDGKTSVSQMTRLLEKQANGPVDEAMVWLAFDELGKAKLLRDNKRPTTSGISRRELIRRVGTAAVIALPVVSSIVAPGAVEAATCRGSGQACTTAAQCCSFVCSGGTTCA